MRASRTALAIAVFVVAGGAWAQEEAEAFLQKHWKPYDWQVARVETVSRESIPELVAHLSNPDDFGLAYNPALSGDSVGSGTQMPREAHLIVTRMARVGRLLEEGRKQPEAVIPPLREAYREAVSKWPVTCAHLEQAFQRGPQTSGQFRSYRADAVTSLAAVYILSELGDTYALPLMLRDWKHYQDYSEVEGASKPSLHPTVGPGTLLYGMYRVIIRRPEVTLTAEAWEARKAFISKADAILPAPAVDRGLAWNARYADDDQRLRALAHWPDVQELFWSRQPMTDQVVWPHESLGGEELSSFSSEPSPEARELLSLAEKFIRLAFPQECEDIPEVSQGLPALSEPQGGQG